MSCQQTPTVSVVIPVFNAGRYLSQAIQSVLSQTFADFELIAVDDESSDGSVQILERFADQDSRIRILRRSHSGIVRTRNAGISAAGCALIANLDHDDIMLPNRLESQVDYMQRHPDCVAVGSAARLIDPDGDPLLEIRPPIDHEQIDTELLRGKTAIVQTTAMLRREAVLSIGGYRDQCNFAEDYDLFLRLSECGQLANLPQVLGQQRQHFDRSSRSNYEQQNRVIGLALQEAFDRRGIRKPLPHLERIWHPETLSGFRIRCVNDAMDGGNIQTARKHARQLLRDNRFSPRAWDLMARAFLDRRIYSVIKVIKSILRPFKRILLKPGATADSGAV